MSERYGVLFKTGEWEFTIAFRVVDPEVADGKRIVCGCCVLPDETNDSRRTCGALLCEQCNLKMGRSEAHEAALAIAGNR